jgi:hypothetical protein
LIGFAAAFIISLFPKPTSARKIVRLRAARIIDALADLYTDELKGFLMEAKESGNLLDENKMDQRAGLYRAKVLDIVVGLNLVFFLSRVAVVPLTSFYRPGTTGRRRTSIGFGRFRA